VGTFEHTHMRTCALTHLYTRTPVNVFASVPHGGVSALQKDLRQLLSFVRQAQTVDTTGIEPLHSVLEDIPMRLRDDVAEETGDVGSQICHGVPS
jgi:aspartyl/glutamyl-tRNA(Asn/Gln) amidotransferase C subunit